MIVVRIKGGLGNQMFQYAFSLALRKHRRDVKFDLGFYERQNARTLELEKAFRIRADPLRPELGKRSLAERADLFGRAARKLNRVFKNLPQKRQGRVTVTDEHGWIEIEKYVLLREIVFDGYWQNSAYFAHIEDEIRHAFSFKVDGNNWLANISARIEREESVAVHVRRGDYYKEPVFFKIYGNICDEQYYRDAMRYIMERRPKARFYVFSDDHEWSAAQSFFNSESCEIVGDCPGKETWWDMYLMSKCRHIIIANSSYSWWAAWLNSSPEKIVVAPRKWVNIVDKVTVNIIEQGWHRI